MIQPEQETGQKVQLGFRFRSFLKVYADQDPDPARIPDRIQKFRDILYPPEMKSSKVSGM